MLAPGGRYAFTVWASPEEAVGFGVVLRAMATHGTTEVGLPDGPPFFRFSDADESRGALSRAGFTDAAVRMLPLVWQLPSAAALFDAALHGGVRTSAALQAQTPDALAAIRDAVLNELQQYATGDGIAVPMPVVLASGTKPSAGTGLIVRPGQCRARETTLWSKPASNKDWASFKRTGGSSKSGP